MKRLIYRALILAIILSGVWALGLSARKHWVKVEEGRRLEDAVDALNRKDFRNAALCLRQALQINPKNVEAITQMAEVLELEGAPDAALEWRMRASELQPHDAEARLRWAQTAIRAGELKSASEALAGVGGESRQGAQYHKLAGALAWRLGDKPEAETNYIEAARLEPANETTAFDLLTVRLSSTNQAKAEAARLCMEQQVTNASLRLVALRQLVTYERMNQSWSKALDYSREVMTNAESTYDDRLDHLVLLHEAGEKTNFDSWLGQLKQTSTNSPARAFALGKRLEKIQSPTEVLAWVQSLPEEVQATPPVPQVAADCYMALKDWPGLLGAVENQNWAEAESARLALIAFARRSLGQDEAAQTAWRGALDEAAHRREGLSSLARLTAAWGWEPERKQVVSEIASEFPKERGELKQ
jgi:tetratricopeptide (TPR) repeat protein